MPTGDEHAEILCAFGGLDAVTHALEAYVSVLANEYSDGRALQALKLLKEYLPASYKEGAKNPVARERVHNAATIAGIAFANAFLGVCHSMAHKLGSEFHIPHGGQRDADFQRHSLQRERQPDQADGLQPVRPPSGAPPLR